MEIKQDDATLQLVAPAMQFKTAFLAFYDDYARNDIENGAYYTGGKDNFSLYVQKLTDESNGINLPEGYVPCSHFWLMDSDQSILGVIRLRHQIDSEFLMQEAGHIGYDIAPSSRRNGYATTMLNMVLVKAKQRGISRVLVTADDDNVASRKVIEANAGQLENIIMGKVFQRLLARYWINC